MCVTETVENGVDQPNAEACVRLGAQAKFGYLHDGALQKLGYRGAHAGDALHLVVEEGIPGQAIRTLQSLLWIIEVTIRVLVDTGMRKQCASG